MAHIVLLGDSIFDNAAYVPGELPVIEQMRGKLPPNWKATLLAIDGHYTTNVARQLEQLPEKATHLFVSAGGNDALSYSSILYEPALSVAQVLSRFADILAEFKNNYAAMLKSMKQYSKPVAICTIYDSVPDLDQIAVIALSLFNDVILREACAAALPVIDLRLTCNDPLDYSTISSIEPSAQGGEKIADKILEVMTTCDFSNRRSVIYA